MYRSLKDIPAIDQGVSVTPSTCFSQKTKSIITWTIFIHIGDLYRYEIQYSTPPGATPDYSKAESAYKQVISLDPGSGVAHHQLAILAVGNNADILVLYRYIRSIACTSPFPAALKNLRILFIKNEKMMADIVMEPRSKKEGIAVAIAIVLHRRRSTAASSSCCALSTKAAATAPASPSSWRARSSSSVASRLACKSDYLLKYDAFSTQYVFRVIMVAIFAACDLWNNGAEKGGDAGDESQADSSQSGVLSDGCLNGWICLFSLITRVLVHTYTDPSRLRRCGFSQTCRCDTLRRFVCSYSGWSSRRPTASVRRCESGRNAT